MGKTISWLHLSDLHYCAPTTGYDAAHMSRDLFERELPALRKKLDFRPDFIIFTGDAAFGQLGDESGKRLSDQFDEVSKEYFSRLLGIWEGFSRENFFIVPGNHDVNRKLDLEPLRDWLTAARAEGAAGVKKVQNEVQGKSQTFQSFMQRLGEYLEFIKKNNWSHLTDDLNRLIYTAVRQVGDVKVGIAGMNSAWSCGKEDEPGRIWMAGEWQCQHLARILMDSRPDFCIALVHHPWNWLVEGEQLAVQSALQRHFQFVLHGHEHRGWVEATNNTTTRIAGAACYAGSQNEQHNGFNLVKMDVDKVTVRIWLRRFDQGAGKWGRRDIPGFTESDGSGCRVIEDLKWLKELRQRMRGQKRGRDAPRRRVKAKPLKPEPVPAIRPAAETAIPLPPERFACDFSSRIWEVLLPAGDVLISDTFVNLHGASPKAGSVVPLAVSSPMLGVAHLKAVDLLTAKELPIQRKRSQDGQQVNYSLDLRAAKRVKGGATIAVQRRFMGVVMTSREAQRYRGVPPTGEESCSVIIRSVECGMFHCAIRFRGQGLYEPEKVFVRVKDTTVSPHAKMNLPASAAFTFVPIGAAKVLSDAGGAPEARAILAIDHPTPGHQFTFYWKLPEEELADNREALTSVRSSLVAIGQEKPNEGRRLALVERLHGMLKEVRDLIGSSKKAAAGDPSLLAIVHGLDQSGLLHFCASSDFTHRMEKPIRFGEAIIGNCVQSRAPFIFNRATFKAEESFRLEGLGDSFQVVFSYPLLWPDPGGLPVGALSIASSVPSSELIQAANDPTLATDLALLLEEQWRTEIQGLLLQAKS